MRPNRSIGWHLGAFIQWPFYMVLMWDLIPFSEFCGWLDLLEQAMERAR
jgi:hypothetical protein